MYRKPIESFNNLKHGDLIISPIDNEVTQFFVAKDGSKFLTGKKSLFDLYQFNAEDFYFYDGNEQIGEVDKEYFKWKIAFNKWQLYDEFDFLWVWNGGVKHGRKMESTGNCTISWRTVI